MQVSLYFTEEDTWLLKRVDEQAALERRSRNAVILSILEGHFTGGKKIGQVLETMGTVSPEDIARALETQQHDGQPLGAILVVQNIIRQKDLKKALDLQEKGNSNHSGPHT